MCKASVLKFGLFMIMTTIIASPAFGGLMHYANPQQGAHVVLNYTSEGAGGDSGGPFQATLYDAYNNPTDVWKTFCVEADGGEEDFSPGTTYQVWSTDPHVAAATGNYVTNEAKWLYYQSLHHPESLVGYTPDNIDSDTVLQQAIWHGVLHNNNPLNITYSDLAATWYNAAAAAVATPAGLADADLVRVINPADLEYTGTGVQAQSQLYETTIYDIPEPSTIVLLGMWALGLLAYARRQRKKV